MLRAADVTFAYRRGDPVLDGVSLEVRPGEFVGILGPNGSGKTTLLKVLAGTVSAHTGRVTLAGVALERIARSALARRMALVPQETHLAFDYSVLEIVLMGRYPHLGPFEVEGPADLRIARDALASTGTLALQDRPFHTLSGGEKQRVIIASALAQIAGAEEAGTEPILLLDEPTAALDLGHQLDSAALLRGLREKRRVSVVISTHELNFAASLCDTLVLLRGGRVLASGPTESVLTREAIRALYDVNAHVSRDEQAGHVVVIPLSRTAGAG